MTDVWRTRGVAYHARPDCQGILDGQAEATRKGMPNHLPERVHLTDLHLEAVPPRPCRVCWPTEPGWFSWLPVQLDTENHSGARDGSPYELMFLDQVLRKVDDLDPSWITVQARVQREHREPLRPDFVIERPGRQPIALEVDGAQKSAHPHPDESEHTIRRDAELEKAGYRVQHFTNTQVTTDSGWCRQRVAELLDVVEAEYRSKNQQPGELASSAVPTLFPATARGQQTPVGQPPSSNPPRHRAASWVAGLLVAAAASVVLVLSLSDDDLGGVSADVNGECDSAHEIKGNVTDEGDKIFHQPGWQFYNRTNAEQCFTTARDAEDAGYRASEAQ